MIIEKRCWKCDTTKSVSEFSTNVARKDGLQVYCIPCRQIYARYIRAQLAKQGRRRLS